MKKPIENKEKSPIFQKKRDVFSDRWKEFRGYIQRHTIGSMHEIMTWEKGRNVQKYQVLLLSTGRVEKLFEHLKDNFERNLYPERNGMLSKKVLLEGFVKRANATLDAHEGVKVEEFRQRNWSSKIHKEKAVNFVGKLG